MTARANERLALEHSLRRALERDEFLLHYQSEIDVETECVIGAEALLQHPEWGLVAPERFIPIAEGPGSSPRSASGYCAPPALKSAWQDAGLPALAMSFNLSARQFRHETLAKTVCQILAETGTAAGNLEVELTESLVMHNAEVAVSILRELKSLGVRVSIDDFGVGYASLSYLRRLPIDTLKIDRSFVSDIAAPPKGDGGILSQAIISLATVCI
jgi:EAL domain-containing protein (putative c-di-GMP-specific phosphodiesterase class I)